MHLSLTTGVVALHIPSGRARVREERRQERKTVSQVIQSHSYRITNHHKHTWYWFLFWSISCMFKHTENEPYRQRRQDGGWHAFSIVTHTTAWRRELQLYTSRRQEQPLQFRAKNITIEPQCIHIMFGGAYNWQNTFLYNPINKKRVAGAKLCE